MEYTRGNKKMCSADSLNPVHREQVAGLTSSLFFFFTSFSKCPTLAYHNQ